MTFEEACALLGVHHNATETEIRDAYRQALIEHHPDRSSNPQAQEIAAQLAVAYQRALNGPTIIEKCSTSKARESVTVVIDDADHEFFLEAPFDEAFRLVLDVASQFGGIGYIDRHLGICEIMVRFVDGPTCSVMFTLDAAPFGTKVSCAVESIEAAPTPDPSEFIRQFTDALSKADL